MSETSSAAVDARLDPRYPASAVPSIAGVGLSPGGAVELVNISRSGVLVEGRIRFVPGTRVTIIFEGGFAPSSHQAKVIRCQVASIVGGVLHYHSGIQFEQRLEVLETVAPAPSMPAGGAAPPAPVPEPAPEPASARPSPKPAPPAAPADNACRPPQRTTGRRRAVNRW